MRRRTLALVIATMSLLASACGASDTDGDSPSPTAATASSTDVQDPPATSAVDRPGEVTAAALARLRALDREVLATAHDHDDHDEGSRDHAGHADRDLFDLPSSVEPERIVIPAIGVDATVVGLGLAPSGEVEVPSDFDRVGWFDETPRPGRVGVSVLTGHVDSRSGPAVFFRLAELSPGDRIEIHGVDGDVVEFEMRTAEQHAKSSFPVDEVFRASDRPELVLVTCGGVFDTGERSYRDNIIVTAERVDD